VAEAVNFDRLLAILVDIKDGLRFSVNVEERLGFGRSRTEK